jgi:hypothetical protein
MTGISFLTGAGNFFSTTISGQGLVPAYPVRWAIGHSSFPRGVGHIHPSVQWALVAYSIELQQLEYAAGHTSLTVNFDTD